MGYLKAQCEYKMLMKYFDNKAKLNRIRAKIKSKKRREYKAVVVSKSITIIYYKDTKNEKK